MTDRPIMFSPPMVVALLDGRKTMTRRLAWRWPKSWGHARPIAGAESQYCDPTIWQRVVPGDRLWVREAYHTDAGVCIYRDAAVRNKLSVRWRSPLHMPRSLSRITLDVVAARIERLQSITNEDALVEGAPAVRSRNIVDDGVMVPSSSNPNLWLTPRLWFQELWVALHGEAAWEQNPQVVVMSFTVHRRNIDE